MQTMINVQDSTAKTGNRDFLRFCSYLLIHAQDLLKFNVNTYNEYFIHKKMRKKPNE